MASAGPEEAAPAASLGQPQQHAASPSPESSGELESLLAMLAGPGPAAALAMEAHTRASDALNAMKSLAASAGATETTVALLRGLEQHLGQPPMPSAPTAVPVAQSPPLSPSSQEAPPEQDEGPPWALVSSQRE